MSNVWVDIRNSSCLVLQVQSAEISWTLTGSFVWSWMSIVNFNEGTQYPESWTQYSSFVSALFPVYAHWTPVHLTWGLSRMRAACPTPCLNWSWSCVPHGATSMICSPPGPCRIQQIYMSMFARCVLSPVTKHFIWKSSTGTSNHNSLQVKRIILKLNVGCSLFCAVVSVSSVIKITFTVGV